MVSTIFTEHLQLQSHIFFKCNNGFKIKLSGCSAVVARVVWDHDVVGSNPTTRTIGAWFLPRSKFYLQKKRRRFNPVKGVNSIVCTSATAARYMEEHARQCNVSTQADGATLYLGNVSFMMQKRLYAYGVVRGFVDPAFYPQLKI